MIIPIYKEKGYIMQDCGNYRGVKLMSHTVKIWERIIERRLKVLLSQVRSKQCTIGPATVLWDHAHYLCKHKS